MFKTWLENNNVNDYDFSGALFPKASDRAFWETKYDEKVVKEAEKYLGYNWPLIRATDYMAFRREGSLVKQMDIHLQRRIALMYLTLAEVLEHKGRFIDDIIDGVFIICEETFWGVSSHISGRGMLPIASDPHIALFVSETAELLSVIYYMLDDELNEACPDILKRIEYEIDRRITTSYLTRTDFWWMGYSRNVNNWNPWIISNLLTVFLLMEKDRDRLHQAIVKMLTEIQNYYKTIPPDGGCDEGSTYWGAAGGMLCEFCDQLYRATNGRINFFGDERIQNVGKYLYRVYIGNGWFVNYADGSPIQTNTAYAYIAYLYGQRIQDTQLSSLSKELWMNCGAELKMDQKGIRRELNSLIYADRFLAQPDFVPQEAAILPNLQNTFVREGKWYYAAKGGSNYENHNHNDVGSFIAYYDNQPVLVDPSNGTYTYKTFAHEHRWKLWNIRSDWHNLPFVNECEQPYGPASKTDGFSLDGKTTTMSFPAAYPEKAGLEALSRTVNISDEGIDVADSFGFKEPKNVVSEHFITPLDVRITDHTAVIGERFVLTADADCVILLDSMDFEGDRKLTAEWGTDKLNRIKFVFQCDQTAEVKITLRRI